MESSVFWVNVRQKQKKRKKNKKRRSRIMGVKGDNVLLAGGERGGRSPPNKSAKQAERCFAAGGDLLTLKQSKLPIHNSYKNKGRKRIPPLNHILLFHRQAGSMDGFLNSAGSYSALGLVSPDRPQSLLRCFALIFTPGVTLL